MALGVLKVKVGGTWQLVPGVQGPQGDIGPQGPQGVQGPIGLTGPQGPIGNTGPQGIQGIQGPIGPIGPQGPIGNTGPQGPIGLDGPTGPQGPIGPAGPQGIQGIQGPIGPQGIPGDLAGPASAVDQNLVLFSGTTGKIVADSGIPKANVLTYSGGYPGGTTLFLRADGTWQIAGDVKLDAANVFTQNQTISAASPALVLRDTSQPVDQRNFVIVNTLQLLQIYPTTDAFAVQSTPLKLARNGNVTVGGNLLVTKVRPEVILQTTGDILKARFTSAVPGGRIDLSTNMAFDGATWVRDDATKTGGLATLFETGRFGVWALTAAGAFNNTFVVTEAGLLTTPGPHEINTAGPMYRMNAGAGNKWQFYADGSNCYLMYCNDSWSWIGTHCIIADKVGNLSTGGRFSAGKGIGVRSLWSGSTPQVGPNPDLYDLISVWDLAGPIVIDIGVTPAWDGWPWTLRLRDNGAARAINWHSNYMSACGVALPTSTAPSRSLYIGFRWNSGYGRWHMIAISQE